MYLRCLLSLYLLISVSISVWSNNAPGLVYIENKNQWAEDVFFSAQLPIGAIYLKSNSFHYFLRDVDRFEHLHEKYEDRMFLQVIAKQVNIIIIFWVAIVVSGLPKLMDTIRCISKIYTII